ncbi:uncharacterized protein LOC108481412 [Gossypium arboreum]|uniref:RNase H type-1 domain-containing protein n=1 Tax=Gossypium arboreum TaxID=29729 RepID=A0ABR0MWE2_GOSAR|nr:uncharacterized protein LOC108481412 [Gossypium arboreum]KAK5777635.1 hypothetical protein PVK06_045602 [Gossypium arboreum]
MHDTVEFINAYYAEIKHVSDVTKSRNEINNKAWRPPNDNRIKVNFDAAFKQNQNKSVSGIIARNKEGEVMAACTYPGRNIVDPTIAEARACLQAATMAENLGFQEVEVEGDALTVIKKLTLNSEDKSTIRGYIQEIKRKACIFRSIQFSHIPREANRVAHELGREGWRFEDPQYWMEEVPNTVEDLVNRDRNHNNGRRDNNNESGSGNDKVI